ncbi:MAG: acyltransferase [Clostridiales bacterium]|nr:acyltransferase [Clostridiales bacterium]
MTGKKITGLLSQNRVCLMGFAILCIMFTHNSIEIGIIWSTAKIIAQIGVDLFLFLSGYGLYNSYMKSPEGFYKRRFIRIIPTYLLVTILYIAYLKIFTSSSIKEALWNFSLISFFTDGIQLQWFIAIILLLYLLYPVLFRLVNVRLAVILTCCVAWSSSLLICYGPWTLPVNIIRVFSLFIIRIPVFIAGSYVRSHEHQFGKNDGLNVLAAVCSIVCIILVRLYIKDYWPLVRVLFFPATISICNILASLFSVIPENRKRFFSILGSITLELYLIHEKVLWIMTGIMNRFTHIVIPDNLGWTLIVNLSAVVLSIFAGIFCAYIIKRIVKPERMKKQKLG